MNKSTPKIIAVFFAIICFFSAVQAQEPVPYIITGNVTDRFTATQSGSVVGEADTSIAYIIASIQGSCGSGTDCTIQFGNGTSVLDIGADSAYFGGTWGIINLTGKITSANNNSNFGTIHITLASVTDVAVNINADIENTGSAGRAVYLASTRAVNVTGGKIEAKGTGASRAIHSNSTAVLTISGSAEIISAGTGNAINQTSGTTNIIGGTISTIGSGNAFQQTSGTTNVNGGTISTIGNGNAIYQTNGTINVNGGTVSATGTGYAIYQTSVGTINVNGGTVSTASGYTIHNDANAGGTVSIKGGTVENKTANSYAIFNGSTGLVVLSGDPTVTGVIRAAFGKLSADATFAPGALKSYAIDFIAPYLIDTIAVVNGASHIAKFVPYNFPAGYGLAASGSDIAIVSTITDGYTISGTNPYVITKGDGIIPNINNAITQIRGSCGTGTTCAIQFGNGTSVLDIGTDSLFFGGTWGIINLTGKITSANNTSFGTIHIYLISVTDVAVNINADIENTGSGGRAIYISSTRAVNIAGGRIEVKGTEASRAINSVSAVITISGSAVITAAGTDYAIYQTTGTINVNGGTVSATGIGSAIYQTTGTINVNGGTVTSSNESTASGTIHNASSGTINISGGTIKNEKELYAIYNANTSASIVLDGDPNINSVIRTRFGTLRASATFTPSSARRYWLEFGAPYAMDLVAVAGGGTQVAKFMPYNFPAGYGLAASGSDVVIGSTVTDGYAVEGTYPSFNITKGSGNLPNVNSAINKIRNSCGTDTECSIKFGNGTEVLDIGADSAYFGDTWGKINLTGKITSANNTSTSGTIYISLASVTDVAININADIANTGSAGRAVYLASTRAVNVTGGKIEVKGTGASRAIHSNSTAVLTISGSAEIISAGTSSTIYQTSGTTNIIGGTISTIGNGNAFQQTSGTTNVNGGTVSATGTGYAIYQTSNGSTINVNGGTVSAASGYTICNATDGGTVSIKGGTVENKTANGYAIYNSSIGPTVLGGDPAITGVIRTAFGSLSLNAFAPTGSKTYTLEFIAPYVVGSVAIAGGASQIASFVPYNFPTNLNLAASGADIVIGSTVTDGYTITGSAPFTITKGTGNIPDINSALISIRNSCGTGLSCSIRFGTGTDTLDIGTGTATFDGTWGEITLLGKITSANVTSAAGTISIAISGTTPAININAEILNSAASSANAKALYHSSTRPVNITGGKIEAVGSGRAIYNNSTADFTISGGTVSSATSYAIYNNSTGSIILSGDPTVTGVIRAAFGKLSADATFAPGALKSYAIEFPAPYVIDTIAVTGGASHIASFVPYNFPAGFGLDVSGSNIVIVSTATDGYAVSGAYPSFVITKGTGTLPNVNTAITQIRGSCGTGTTCAIQLGDGTSVLDIGTDSLVFGGTWGIINLTGKITSANNTSYGTIHINLASVTDVAVNINADIENTGSGGRAIYLSSTRAVNIAGGRIEAKGTEASRAINSASAVITISGSAVITAAGIGTSLAIYQTSGTINVNGGTVSATGTGMAIYQTTGTTNVNGGMVSAASGYAIQNNATGTVNIKGGTVTSSISSATSGTIYNASTGKLNISGGTITNGATGTSIYNAIYNASTGLIVLDGNPDIGLSAIRTAFGTLSVAGTFAPGTLRMYALELVAPYALGSVAVTDGGSYAAKFIPNNFPAGYGLAASGSDVVIVSTLTNGYAVEGIYPSFSITKGSGNHHDINSALISIRNSCGTGTECSIQFGDGTEVLGIGTDSAIIDGTWGKVNLTGKITSANNSTSVGTIYVNLASGEDLAVNINADIENTGNTGRAIYLVSDRAVNITGGKIKATGTGASRAIISNSTAVLTISGNAEIISAGTSYTIYQTTGTINIFGGIIEAASDIAVFNATAGSIVLGNNPVLNGFIRTSAQRLSVVASGLTNEFAPVAKTYSLDFAAYAENSVAVLGGKDFLANFKLTNSNWKLVASGNDLVLVEKTEADFEEEACVAAGNTWVGGQCKTSVQLAEEACVAAGNTWVGGQCKTSVQLAEEACVAAGNTWVGGQCKTSAQLAEEACLAAGNTWVDGQCKTSVQLAEEACVAAGNTWIGGQCKTSAQLAEEACVAAGNTWVNNACVTTPVQKGRMFANNLGILKNGEGFLVQGLSKPETVRIFDMQGKVLMSKTVMPNENVSISHLPKGIYLVNVNGKSFKLAK